MNYHQHRLGFMHVWERVGGLRVVAVCVAAYGTIAGVAAGPVRAVDIVLHESAQVVGPVVRLGEIALINRGAESEAVDRFEDCELFPAPPPGGRRVLAAVEVRDLLQAAGIPLVQVRMSGASRVEITSRDPARDSAAAAVRRGAGPRQAKRVLQQAIAARLTAASGREELWQVEFQMTPGLMAMVASSAAVQVEGGEQPWVGRQSFRVSTRELSGQSAETLEAVVGLPTASVVARRAVPGGTVLLASDLELSRQAGLREGPSLTGASFSSLDEVIGQETTRALSPGQVVDRRSVRKLLWVQRGDLVTVYARAPGIEVRTTGRAKDEGASGDLVSVEQPGEKKRFFARVTGFREVEVYAAAAKAGP